MMKVNYESPREVKHGLENQHDNELVVLGMMEINYELAREVKHDLLPSVDRQNCKKPGTPQHSNRSSLDGFLDMGDSDNVKQNEDAQVKACYSVPTSKVEVFKKDAGFYTDKNITEIDLSEEVVCFEDVSYHEVKDICVDVGIHSSVKHVAETVEEEKNPFSRNPFATDEIDDVSENVLNCIVPISDDLKLLLENGHAICGVDKDDPYKGPSQILLEVGGELISSDHLTSEVSAEEPSGRQVLALQELDMEQAEVNMSQVNVSAEELSGKQVLALQKLDMDLAEVNSSGSDGTKQPFETQRKVDKVKLEEEKPGTTYMSFTVNESSKSNEAKKNPVALKVDSGLITFNFDSGTAAGSDKFERKEDASSELSGQSQNYPKLEESSANDAEASASSSSARNSFVHHGELGSPGPAALSGRIAFSGHIPFSGSISLRSDSSTTSARSFAFPILHSEWNSSPIKMAKADRRHQRKHRGWRMRLVCCRF